MTRLSLVLAALLTTLVAAAAPAQAAGLRTEVLQFDSKADGLRLAAGLERLGLEPRGYAVLR